MRPSTNKLLVTAALLLGATESATAASYSLTSRTVFHAYQLRLFEPEAAQDYRRFNRFYEWVDARIYGLGPNGDIRTVLSMRYDHDFGTAYPRDGFAVSQLGASDEKLNFEMAYLYVDWRNIIKNVLDLRLGRQLLMDELDWYSLDGIKVTVHLSTSHYVELYGGRAVPFGAFLSSEPFLNDGIEVSDGESLALGGAYFGQLGEDLSFALAYRHELRFREDKIEVFGLSPSNPEAEYVSGASAGKIGLQEWLLGASVGYVLRGLDLDVYARGTWNFLFKTLDQARAGLSYNPGRRLHWSAEVIRVHPRFAGDSIFNIFNIFPYDRARTEFDWEILDGLRLEAGYFLQHMYGGPTVEGFIDNPDSPYTPSDEFQGSARSHGPSAGVRYRSTRWGLGVHGEAATNLAGYIAYGGTFRRAEAYGHFSILSDQSLQTNMRFSYTGFQNDWFERVDYGEVQDEERSYSADLGIRWAVTDSVLARANVIKNFSSLLEGSYRVYSSVEFRYE
jgi:hypothetical protein